MTNLTIELEDSVMTEICEAAQFEEKTCAQYVEEALQSALGKRRKQLATNLTDEEKAQRTLESYRQIPQQQEEYEVWQDEQVWNGKKKMQTVEIELEEQVLAILDQMAEELQTNRVKFIQRAVWSAMCKVKRNRPKREYTDEEVSQMYAEAYGKNPVRPDEFYVEEEQLIEAWKDL